MLSFNLANSVYAAPLGICHRLDNYGLHSVLGWQKGGYIVYLGCNFFIFCYKLFLDVMVILSLEDDDCAQLEHFKRKCYCTRHVPIQYHGIL